MVAEGMDATGAHGCKVKNLRKARFVLPLGEGWSAIAPGRSERHGTRHHYQIVKSVFGLATNGQLAMATII
jgi:hypothetical protein